MILSPLCLNLSVSVIPVFLLGHESPASVVFVVDVLLLLGLEYCSRNFIFLVSFFFFWLCVHLYCH